MGVNIAINSTILCLYLSLKLWPLMKCMMTLEDARSVVMIKYARLVMMMTLIRVSPAILSLVRIMMALVQAVIQALITVFLIAALLLMIALLAMINLASYRTYALAALIRIV